MEGKSQKRQRGLQLLCSKGHREEQLEMEGSLSYMWVSMAGNSLYLVEKGHKKGEFAANPQHLSTQAWKGNSLQLVVGLPSHPSGRLSYLNLVSLCTD